MSDIGMPDGLGAVLAGFAYLGIDALLLLVWVVAIVVQLVRKKSPWNGVVLGLTVCIAMIAISAAGSFAAAEYAGEPADEYLLFWFPSLLFLSGMGGFVSGLVAHNARGEPSR